MTNEAEGKSEKMSPAERARRLAREAAQKREDAEAQQQKENAARYSTLKELLASAAEKLVSKSEELEQVQAGLDEIGIIEQRGPLSEELLELRTELVDSKAILSAEKKEAGIAVLAIEADPLYVEFAAAELAAKEEAARAKLEEKEELKKQEKRDRNRRVIENLDATIREISAAIGVAERREQDIVELRKEKKALEKAKDELAKDIEGDVEGLLSALPEPVRVKIDLHVYEAQKSGKSIHQSSSLRQDGKGRYPPAGTTMPEWFAAWRENVTPSIIPFLDKPLRALRDFEGDPRIGEMQGLVERQQELSDKEKALFADRKDTNNLFMRRLLGPNSGLMTLNRVDWEMLRHSEGVDQQALQGKLQSLRNFKEKSSLLTADVDDELSKKYNAQGGSMLFSPIGANVA